MKKVILYDLVHDEQEKPELIVIKEFDVVETVYDEEFGVYLMSECLNLGIMENEHSYVIGINSNNEITGIVSDGLGSRETVTNSTRLIILFLSLTGSKRFSCYHNHPNNNVVASSDDIANEAQMEFIAKLMEIEFLGSYILGRDKYIKVGSLKAHLIRDNN